MLNQFKTPIWFLFFLLLFANIFAQNAENSLKINVIGTGRPVIFIHGYSCSGDVWNDMVDRLSDKFQCHIVYLPGFAGTPGINTENYLNDIKLKILEYVKSNKLEKPVLVGHSLGGFLSLLIASGYPDLFGPVIDIDGLAFTPAVINPNATAKSQLPVAKKQFRFDNIPMGTLNTQPIEQVKPYLSGMTNHTEKVNILIEWYKKSDQRILNQSMYDMFTIDLRDEIKKITSPILVFGTWVGYKSYGVTKESSLKSYQAQFKNAANCTIKMSDEGRHFLMWDDYEWLMKEMLEFLSKNK